MTVRILQGNCLDTLALLPDASVDAAMTSPPYWGLRDYGTAPLSWPAVTFCPVAGLPELTVPPMECSLGLEQDVWAFVGHIVHVFREVRRVLHPRGTCWVNMGDSYVGTRGMDAWGPSKKATKGRTLSRRRDDAEIPRSDVRVAGLKAKDMVGQPWRVALALQADGWWLRSECIWDKPNPMPESTKDRPTKSHEQVFLFAKSMKYYFDADAIKEEGSPDTHARYARGRSDEHKHAGAAAVPGQRPQTIAQGFGHMRKPVGGWASGSSDHTAIGHQRSLPGRRTKLLGNGVGWGYADPTPKPRTTAPKAAAAGAYVDGKSARLGRGPGWRVKSNPSTDAALREVLPFRNKRTVWRIPTEGVADAHFATFPQKLVEPCLLASCPVGGTILDPFGGSGTVGLVADRLGRNAILCELSPEYVAIARKRLGGDIPLLASIVLEGDSR